ncbi:hypothetical protein [Dethiothermospora halolimnae]|uniref:hypothetical protein n=1 Tax=Dethiothermospora halolimnae TaxID=3114390 RepID=UPI003CCC1B23
MRLKRMFISIFILLLLVSTNVRGFNKESKTILIILDDLDFKLVDKIIKRDYSMGILNNRTDGMYKVSSYESLFMTIATSRKVNVKEGLFNGISKKSNGSLEVNGYDDILSALNRNYDNFSNKISFFGDVLNNNGIEVGYMGNDSSALIACNKNGLIGIGENKVIYDRQWLYGKTDELLNNADVLVLSIDTLNKKDRIYILKDYIDTFDKYNILIMSKNIYGDMNVKFNSTLSPVIYINRSTDNGLLTSRTTKRMGLISNLDIFPHIASLYNIDGKTQVGNKIDIIPNDNLLKATKDNFRTFVNLNIIKYILHGIIIVTEIIILLLYIIKKNNSSFNLKLTFNTIIIIITGSYILSLLKIYKYIPLYIASIVLFSLLLSTLITKIEINIVEKMSMIIWIFMIYGIFIDKGFLYNTFIGYNNVLVGGRFYGLNNEAMGILLVTSIMVCFYVKEKIKKGKIYFFFIFLIYILNILALSNEYGSNIGGYITSIVLFLAIIYTELFGKKSTKPMVLVFIMMGLALIVGNFFFDFISVNKSHGGSLLYRISVLGYKELLYMIIRKVKQLIFMMVIPPWSIILILQTLFIVLKLQIKNLSRKAKLIFYTSIVALVINDTGVVAFIYMNTFLIAETVNIKKKV